MNKMNETDISFKQTEIGRIPKQWEVVKLGDRKICDEIYYGVTAKATKKDTGIRMLRTTDIKNYSVDWTQLPYCEITEKSNNIAHYLLRENDIIIARAGTVGVSILVDTDFNNVIFGSYLIKVRLNSEVYHKFIHYFFQSTLYWNHIRKAPGSTLKNINLPLLKSLLIPLPPLSEQQKIAEILFAVDEAIQKVDEAIKKTRRLKKGLMQELLTKGIGHKEFKNTEIGRIPEEWEVVEIKDIGKVFTGKTPSTSKNIYWDGNIPFITPQDMTGEKYVYKTNRYVTIEGAKQIGKILPESTVLVVCIGSTIGKVALTSKGSVTNQQINAILCNHEANCDYVYYAIFLRAHLLKTYSGVAAVPIVKKSLFEKFKIPLPKELKEQQKIVNILSDVDKKLGLEGKRKEKLQRIKKGLMNDLLSGRKRVKID